MTKKQQKQVTDARRIEAEVNKDAAAKQKLADKCNWESMSSLAVILHWGDPRLWK